MDTCPECGNSDVRALRSAGGVLYECALCGERFGDRRLIEQSRAAVEARHRGMAPEIWPLAACLEQLPGFAIGGGVAGNPDQPPRVDLLVTGPEALLQLENLAKSLRLSESSLRCRWRIEVRFDLALTVSMVADSGSSLRDAWVDVETLAERIERDRRLSWWRHADIATNG